MSYRFSQRLDRILVEFCPNLGLVWIQPVSVYQNTVIQQLIYYLPTLQYLSFLHRRMLFEVCLKFAIKFGAFEFLKEARPIEVVQKGQSTAAVRNYVVAFYVSGVEGVMVDNFLDLMGTYLGSEVVVIEHKCLILAV